MIRKMEKMEKSYIKKKNKPKKSKKSEIECVAKEVEEPKMDSLPVKTEKSYKNLVRKPVRN